MPNYPFPAYVKRNQPMQYQMPVHKGDDGMIRNVWDIEEIRDLMSLRAYYQAGDLRQKELDELWVSQPEHAAKASYGSNWGYYVGKDEIARWYVDEFNAKRAEQLKVYEAAHPGVQAQAGAGCMYMCPLSTALVRVADDGETAKAIWYVVGQESDLQPDGTAKGRWMNDRLCADFIKEDGVWKIYHIMVANDQSYFAGEKFDMPVYLEPGQDPLEVEFGNPTIKMTVHDNTYNWADNYPDFPRPYKTMGPGLSYGPEDHPLYTGGAK